MLPEGAFPPVYLLVLSDRCIPDFPASPDPVRSEFPVCGHARLPSRRLPFRHISIHLSGLWSEVPGSHCCIHRSDGYRNTSLSSERIPSPPDEMLSSRSPARSVHLLLRRSSCVAFPDCLPRNASKRHRLRCSESPVPTHSPEYRKLKDLRNSIQNYVHSGDLFCD